MSTWTNVTDTVLEPGQPIRSVDIIALKNNILAVPGGAANAPRVQTAAIENAAVTSAKLATGNNERDWVLARTAGASAGAVGTYASLYVRAGGSVSIGATFSGAALAYGGGSTSPSGTWRAMTNTSSTSVYLRIS